MDSVKKGKTILIIFIVLTLISDLMISGALTLTYALNGSYGIGAQRLIEGFVRLALTIVILYFLYKGHEWAKWIVAILMIIGGLASASMIVTSYTIIYIFLSILFLGFGIVLFASRDVKNFLRYQKEKRVV